MTTPDENQHEHQNQEQGRPKRRWVEEIEVTGSRLVERIEELLQESSTKRVVIKSQEGKELMSVPLTFGMVAGGILTLGAPLLAALGAAAALLSKVKLEVIREEGEEEENNPPPPTDAA